MADVYLGLDSIFPFGKYKGQPVEQIIVDDPGYLLWLRQERWKKEVTVDNAGRGDVSMSSDIHILLDGFMENNRQYKHKGYKLRYPDGPPIHFSDNVADRPANVTTEKSEAWGAW